MGSVVLIRFSEDLPTPAQNRLRHALELGQWRRAWRAAEEAGDTRAMDTLARQYETVGLP